MKFCEDCAKEIEEPRSLFEVLSTTDPKDHKAISEQVEKSWKVLSNAVMGKLEKNWRKRKEVPVLKRRKHDASRLTVRALAERVLEFYKE
jgi:hypothetical protein